MHAVLGAAAVRTKQLRAYAAFAVPLVLPVSGLWAYGVGAGVGASGVSVTVLAMIVGLLSAEAALLRPMGAEARTRAAYMGAGVLTAALSALALAEEGPALDFAALGGAAVLLAAGLVRGVRVGVLWCAAVIVLSVLWALRDVMFLFLTAVGSLIIGAAIWRLVSLQKRQQQDAQGFSEGQ